MPVLVPVFASAPSIVAVSVAGSVVVRIVIAIVCIAV